MTRARSISRLVSDQVTGNVNISGILTATTLFGEGSGITGISPVGSGVTILDNGVNKGAASKIDFADHFLVTDISSGITTITVGITTENINSKQINNAGITTTASLSVTGKTDLGNLTVSGVSTSTTVNSTILNATNSNLTNLNVSGIATITELNIGNAGAEISGFTTMTTGGYSTIGVVTATAFVGDGANITGINTSQIKTSTLVVSGISTLGKLDIADQTVELTFNEGVGLETKNINATGIITAASFIGDASYTVSGRWTLGANGTSDYTFTGIGFTQTTNDPVLYLARGRVYEFVNNSGGAHPFEIRVSDGGAAYNDGVTNNAAATGVIRFEIPFNAPNTLYYQCTNHAGMGNTITIYPSI